jgi:hypothetical protein
LTSNWELQLVMRLVAAHLACVECHAENVDFIKRVPGDLLHIHPQVECHSLGANIGQTNNGRS